jgi:hypothetical protein
LSQEIHPEDQTVLALIEALEQGAGLDLVGLADPVPGGEAGETLARLYTETLGLIPYELAPVAPSAALRNRIMAVVTGDETQEVARPEAAPAAPAMAAMPATPAMPATVQTPPTLAEIVSSRPLIQSTTQPVAQPAAIPFPLSPPLQSTLAAQPAAVSRRAGRWPLALAAGLALAFLGLSAWMYLGLLQQNRLLEADQTKIDRLQRELDGERAHSAEIAAARNDVDRLRSHLGDLEKTFSLVTSPTVEMSALRPTGRVALASQAHGRIYIAEDHQHWYLSVQDLQPSGTGREYHLWFFGDQGPVSGGTFTAAPGEPVHLSSEHMPRGTKAIIITLEPAAGVPAPSGPEVLRAAPPIKIL